MDIATSLESIAPSILSFGVRLQRHTINSIRALESSSTILVFVSLVLIILMFVNIDLNLSLG